MRRHYRWNYFLTIFLTFSLIFNPLIAEARYFSSKEMANLPSQYSSSYNNDPKMALLGELYLKASTKEAQNKISTLMDNYSKSGNLPALKEIPGAVETVRGNSHYRPPVNPNVINNLNAEIKDADIAVSRYSAEMEAANKCRGDKKCDESFKKASEEKAKALNRKNNTTSALEEYQLVGFLPSGLEKVGQGQGHAPETGNAKPEEQDVKAATKAANQTATQAGETFTETGTGTQNHEGLDPTSMNITMADGFAGQLVMKAIGMVGRSLLLCKGAMSQAEVIAYVSGSVIYVAGEVMAFFQFNKAEKAMKEDVDIKKTTVGMQKESLLKMKENLLQMRQAGATKQKLQTAAAAAFFIAAAIAAGKYGMMIGARMACTSTCLPAAAALVAAPHSPYKSVCRTAMKAAPARTSDLCSNDPMAMISAEKFSKIASIESKSLAQLTPCPPCGPACSPSFALEKSSWILCPTEPPFSTFNLTFFSKDNFGKYMAAVFNTPSKKEKMKDSFAQKVFDNLFNQAQAAGNFSTLLGLGSGAVTMLSVLVFKEWTVFDRWIHGPLGRSIVFSLTGAFALIESQSTQKTVQKIDERIALIDAILTQMGMADATKLSNQRINSDMSFTGSTTLPISANVPDVQGKASAIPFPCVTRPAKDDPNEAGLPQTKGKCISLHAINSKSFTSESYDASEKTSAEQQVKDIGDSKIWNGKNVTIGTGDINSAVSTAASVADNIQGENNISGEALNGAKNLGEKLGLAQNALKNAEDNINKKLKEQGEAPINFSELKNSLSKQFKDGVLQEIKKQNKTPEEALKLLGNSSSFLSSSSEASNSKSKSEKNLSGTDYTGGSQNIYGISNDQPLGLNSPNAQNASLSDLAQSASGSQPQVNQDDPQGLNVSSKEKNQKGEKSEEIINRPDNSIFQIISVRYLKSGLKRLGYLKKVTTEKVSAPVATPAKN